MNTIVEISKFIAEDSTIPLLTVIATILLVIVGYAQARILAVQNQQNRISLLAEYRQLWKKCRIDWGKIIFLGGVQGEYYQILSEERINSLKGKIEQYSMSESSVWALESLQNVSSLMSEICIRVLRKDLSVMEIYPIFGTEFLRHGRSLRNLFEPGYIKTYEINNQDNAHYKVQDKLQNWLIHHDGIKRRCLILVDLLWAEAVRLEDLPPYEIKEAALVKEKTGKLNKKRVYEEVIKLNGIGKLFFAIRLSCFLNHAEFRSVLNRKGIKKSRLFDLEIDWWK